MNTELSIYVYDKKAQTYVEEVSTSYAQDPLMAHHTVCKIFALQNQWDRNLIYSLFLNNNDWFELKKPSKPHISYWLKFKGMKNFSGTATYKIHDKSISVLMRRSTFVFEEKIYLLCSDIEKEYSEDITLISFFNCSSFNKLVECNTEKDRTRKLIKSTLSKI